MVPVNRLGKLRGSKFDCRLVWEVIVTGIGCSRCCQLDSAPACSFLLSCYKGVVDLNLKTCSLS